MEISTIAATTARVNTPESEPEAPIRIQPSKPLSLTNGLLKPHPPLQQHHQVHRQHQNNPAVVVSYKECLKNHAATIGGHAVDGCGEFMPSPSATSTDPTSLKCAACGCHRNFHRRDPEEAPQPVPSNQHVIEYKPHHRHHPPPPPAGHSSPNSASPPPISSSYYPSAPHMLLALSAGVSVPPPGSYPAGILDPKRRKRFRSKFTQDQKKKMYGFADRIGWKMQRQDEQLIADFCGEIGVEKGVFKVWMHNHKHSFVRRDLGQKNNTINGIGGRNSIDNIDDTWTHGNNENNYDGAGDANGSSSSS